MAWQSRNALTLPLPIRGNWHCHRAHAGTHMLEKCCHDLDLANWLMGSMPSRVASFGGLDFFKPEFAGQEKRFGYDTAGKSPVYNVWRDPEGISPFNSDKDILDNRVSFWNTDPGCGPPFIPIAMRWFQSGASIFAVVKGPCVPMPLPHCGGAVVGR